ncbi:MAG TPA: hypothetical protein PLB38_03325 [bacterium]|nr:hypothetical protein [bacterium]
MNSEISNFENTEMKKEGFINLESLSFEFCDDVLVSTFYDKKFRSLADKEKWIEENKDILKRNKDKIRKAVEDGLIKNADPETLWQFQITKIKEGQEKVLAIKNDLKSRINEIKGEVAKRLGEYLPNWAAKKAKIVFTMNDRSDFCINGDIITVDLGRLLFKHNPTENVKEGVTHEVFHLWMSEGAVWSDSSQDRVSDKDIKDRIIFKTVDEGLAVLISGQSLEGHHVNQGRDFLVYKNESFEAFDRFLSERNREALERIKSEEFRNMGHFYVVGNEIAKAILQHDGVKSFKTLMLDARKSPVVFLQRYQEISKEKSELLKIDL